MRKVSHVIFETLPLFTLLVPNIFLMMFWSATPFPYGKKSIIIISITVYFYIYFSILSVNYK
jgi:hypothetical protein